MTSPIAQPTPAQRAWMDLKYGMFLHFGPTTYTTSGWGDGTFPAKSFNPAKLDVAQWADMAATAGMRYAVLTTKHHDGFCLFPSEHTAYCVRNAAVKTDIVAKFVEEFRKAGLKVGLYYSLWDRNFPQYNDAAAYAQYMRLQMTELLTNYGEIVELWFDGGWDKDHPTREWAFEPEWENDPSSGLSHGERWQWRQLYDHIHRLQPNLLVIKNSSSDWPGDVRYHPVDARTSEHYNFIYRDLLRQPRTDPHFVDHLGNPVYLPLEFSTTLDPEWFWLAKNAYSHPSAATICDWYRTARQHQANFLLNLGPNRDGIIPTYHAHFLNQAARELGL